MRFQIPGVSARSTFWFAVVGFILFSGLLLCAQQSKAAPSAPIANFTDIADKAGLTSQNIFGGIDTKKYIIETTGNGVAMMYFFVSMPPKMFWDVRPALSAMSVKFAIGADGAALDC